MSDYELLNIGMNSWTESQNFKPSKSDIQVMYRKGHAQRFQIVTGILVDFI